MKNSYIYIISNKANTVLYIGVTSDLVKRIYEHKNKLIDGFSKTYNLDKLVYFEVLDSIVEAITREKYLKGKSRKFKDSLIDSVNPKRDDLYSGLF